jgi:hypothetical protein
LYKNYENFEIDKLLTSEIFEYFNKGLSFNKEFLAYKMDAIINNTKNEFVIIGDIYKDYTKIFNHLKEAG